MLVDGCAEFGPARKRSGSEQLTLTPAQKSRSVRSGPPPARTEATAGQCLGSPYGRRQAARQGTPIWDERSRSTRQNHTVQKNQRHDADPASRCSAHTASGTPCARTSPRISALSATRGRPAGRVRWRFQIVGRAGSFVPTPKARPHRLERVRLPEQRSSLSWRSRVEQASWVQQDD